MATPPPSPRGSSSRRGGGRRGARDPAVRTSGRQRGAPPAPRSSPCDAALYAPFESGPNTPVVFAVRTAAALGRGVSGRGARDLRALPVTLRVLVRAPASRAGFPFRVDLAVRGGSCAFLQVSVQQFRNRSSGKRRVHSGCGAFRELISTNRLSPKWPVSSAVPRGALRPTHSARGFRACLLFR